MAVPLEHLFGFCEDYDRAVYGVRHTLTLVKTADDNNAIFKAADAKYGKIALSKIAWLMPKVLSNDDMKYELYKSIESKDALDVGFRMS